MFDFAAFTAIASKKASKAHSLVKSDTVPKLI
jgi:hypothetical protein